MHPGARAALFIARAGARCARAQPASEADAGRAAGTALRHRGDGPDQRRQGRLPPGQGDRLCLRRSQARRHDDQDEGRRLPQRRRMVSPFLQMRGERRPPGGQRLQVPHRRRGAARGLGGALSLRLRVGSAGKVVAEPILWGEDFPFALPGISPLRAGELPIEFDVAVLPFSPAGIRWPEGPDEGVARTNPLRLRPPPHPPAGTFSPRGRRGWGNGFLP
nr:hypothetical protein SHINE37_40607 [Rhizobiaceae bacterium]